jgi:hypothetical protein
MANSTRNLHFGPWIGHRSRETKNSIGHRLDLCRHDKEALDLVIEWTTKKPGGANNPEGNNQYQAKEVNHNNVMNDQTKAIQGNSLDYTLRRLRKEAPELVMKSDSLPKA